MKYLVMVLVVVTIISLFQYAQARDIGPFMFGLADEEGDWIKHSDSSATDYYGILNQGQTINLPLKIIAGSVPTPLEFHATIGEQMGPEKLPSGIKVEIEPKSFLIEPEKDVTLNIFITAEKNAPSNVYSIGIVGVWPEPVNNFSGTSVKIHVGRYFGPDAVPDNFFPPPLKQIKEGSLPSEVVCTNDFVLIIKNNGNPACVIPTTKQKLIERGWSRIENSIMITGTDMSINYQISGGKISSIEGHSREASGVGQITQTSLFLMLDTTNHGKITLILPRDIIDAKVGDNDDGFMVVLDEMETEYTDVKTDIDRTISFSFPAGTKNVEIIGYGYYNNKFSNYTGKSLE